MRELTGRHVLAITVSAFAVIIGVNVLLAVKAVTTFPGLEVENSYAAQEALGWTLTPAYADGRVTLAFTDRAGLPVKVKELQVLIGRTTQASDDQWPTFAPELDAYAADVTLARGKWMVKVTARSADGVLFEQRSELFVES